MVVVVISFTLTSPEGYAGYHYYGVSFIYSVVNVNHFLSGPLCLREACDVPFGGEPVIEIVAGWSLSALFLFATCIRESIGVSCFVDAVDHEVGHR